jgi:hypothetical protein
MQLKDCLSVSLQARQTVTTQWAVYFGLVTFIITSLVLGKDPVVLTNALKILGTIAFVCFAAVNLRGLVEGYRLLYAMTEEAKAVVEAEPPRSEHVKTFLAQLAVGDRVAMTYVVQAFVGAALLALIWSDWLRNGARIVKQVADAI